MVLQLEQSRFQLQAVRQLTLSTLVLEHKLQELSQDWLLVRTQSLFWMQILVRRLFR